MSAADNINITETQPTAFEKEWILFCKKNHLNSVQEAIDYIDENTSLGKIDPAIISKYRSGKRKVAAATLPLFANLFGVSQEYLLGTTPYRTEADLQRAQKREKDLRYAVHCLLVNLGYADLDIDMADMNITMPQNTQEFLIQKIKESDEDDNILCDVNKELYVDLPDGTYDLLVKDIASYAQFRANQLLSCGTEKEIPQMAPEGEYYLKKNNEIELKNGERLSMDIHYVPTALLGKQKKSI